MNKYKLLIMNNPFPAVEIKSVAQVLYRIVAIAMLPSENLQISIAEILAYVYLLNEEDLLPNVRFDRFKKRALFRDGDEQQRNAGDGVIGILLVMMVPLPTIVLDILLSLSIIIAIIILLMSMYVLKPLDFSAFPSVLLIVTLLRLSLNVASTRLILLHGHEGTGAAGQVIKAFGTFVVGGNYVVGMIVFSVLVLINFVVITKGATRIAEVAARFTLDAMPGKQMSIDADLNTGLISDTEARKRRREIENEANFYGAMDGASKFVRGDAVAGIIIVLVNIIGGLIVGVLQQGMPIADAARTYILLTVGDGLVTQVPALIVSTAAGMLVTRTTASAELGEEIKKQLFTQPKAICTLRHHAVYIRPDPGHAEALISRGCRRHGIFLLQGLSVH